MYTTVTMSMCAMRCCLQVSWSVHRTDAVCNAGQVGGPATAAGMAAAKGWTISLVPALLMGTLGYAIATFVALALGRGVIFHM